MRSDALLELTAGMAVVLDGRDGQSSAVSPTLAGFTWSAATAPASRSACGSWPATRTFGRRRGPPPREAGRGRQPKLAGDLKPGRRELAGLRMAHLLEVATGFRGGDPLRPGPGEPKPEYDPAATTLTSRRRAKAAELKALDPE